MRRAVLVGATLLLAAMIGCQAEAPPIALGPWRIEVDDRGPFSPIACVHEATDGRLWFGTGYGVSRYDPVADSWKTFTKSDGLADDHVRAVAEDAQGRLWFGTGYGVSRYDPVADSWKMFTKSDGLASNHVRAIAMDAEGRLWFGTWDGVSRYDPADDSWKTFTKSDGLADDHVRAVAEDAQGRLWFGTGYGVSRYDPADASWKTFTKSDGLTDHGVDLIAADEQGRLWFATSSGGLSQYDPAADSWKRLSRSGDDNCVWAIAVDAQGWLWFGTPYGVARYDPADNSWKTFELKAAVKAIAADEQGRLWFGTRDGVSRYDPTDDSWKTLTTTDPLAYTRMEAIAADEQGRLWFGSLGGVNRYDPADDSWTRFEWRGVQAIAADEQGRLWLGTRDGVRRYDPADDSWTTFTTTDGLVDNNVQAIAADKKGRLWFGTPVGFSRYDPADVSWTTLSKEDGLGSKHVKAIAADGQGRLWVGTLVYGVSRYDPADGSWKAFTTSDGLVDNRIEAIAEDEQGRLWFGTRDGVSRYDPADDSWKTLTTKDGLVDNHVQAVAVDSQGRLWLGTPSGLSRYDPAVGSVVKISSVATFRGAFEATQHSFIRRGGVSLAASAASERRHVIVGPPGSVPNNVAQGPEGKVWIGYQLAGLALGSREQLARLKIGDGLPEDAVTCLVSVPGSDGTEVWVGTENGAALVLTEEGIPRVLRTLTSDLVAGLPVGPVDAIAAKSDGTVFLGYNRRAAVLFEEPTRAQSRASAVVIRVDPGGQLTLLSGQTDADFGRTHIRSMAFSEQTGLWIGTSGGLYECFPALMLVTRYPSDAGVPVAPIRKVIVDDENHTVLFSTDRQDDVPPSVFGFNPRTDSSFTWDKSKGLPSGDVVHDIGITEDGELSILVGSQLVKGSAVIPTQYGSVWTLLIASLVIPVVAIVVWILFQRLVHKAADPEEISRWPLGKIDTSITRLRRAFLLRGIWKTLDLPYERIRSVQRLSSPRSSSRDRLIELGQLLGVQDHATGNFRAQTIGGVEIIVLPVQIRSLKQFSERQVALVTFCGNPQQADPNACSDWLSSVLKEMKQPYELPVVLLEQKPVPTDCIPNAYVYLRVGESEVRQLMFAKSPETVLAGLLHTKGLMTLSPYSTAGETDRDMFYGREALLLELVIPANPQHIVVGPRRVGKTSLLKRMESQLTESRSDVRIASVSLLGVSEPAIAARILARAIGRTVLEDNPGESAFVTLIQAWCDEDPESEHVLLIDEADGLIDDDSRRDFQTLAGLRNLQEQGRCAFVMTGYLYLLKQTFDQESPLYNFAHVKKLESLDRASAIELASRPMEKLGVTAFSATIHERIADLTGGYPSFIQLVCDAVLSKLVRTSGSDNEEVTRQNPLMVTEEILQRAVESSGVWDYIVEVFRMNTSPVGQLVCYLNVDADEFTETDAVDRIRKLIAPRKLKLSIVEDAFIQLRMFAFESSDGKLSWSIPLLRQILIRRDPERRMTEILSELPEDTTTWI